MYVGFRLIFVNAYGCIVDFEIIYNSFVKYSVGF